MGLLVGSSSAASWWWLGAAHAFEAIRQQQAASTGLAALTVVAMAAFAYKNVSAWHKERQQAAGEVAAKLS